MSRLLDAFCGGGGCGMGYHRAGFDVTGVDISPQPRYPFAFVQAEALAYIAAHGHEYDVIHASPPCQGYSRTQNLSNGSIKHPRLIPKVRRLLQSTGKPYIIENVPGAPLLNYVMLCGTMFGLDVTRHRLFECSPSLFFSPATCDHHKPIVKAGRPPDLLTQFHSVVGHFSGVALARKAMRIDWPLTQHELAQAIPPIYTEWIGKQLRAIM